MQKNDGQRRRDAHDSWAPFVVRPALRRDPEPSISNAAWALGGLMAIGAVIGICVAVVR